MSAIFGVVDLEAASCEQHLSVMAQALAPWGPDGVRTLIGLGAGIGQCLIRDTPEAAWEAVPSTLSDGEALFTAEARLDNRDTICDVLETPASVRSKTPDSTLVKLAYERWGEDAPAHLEGDWSFAAWHPTERRLFIARDQFGQTALYYSWNGRYFAFASDKAALFTLPFVSRKLNEFRFAQRLVVAVNDPTTETIYADVSALRPAHALVLSNAGVRTTQYWSLTNTPQARFRHSAEYAEGLREHIERAVRSCVRTELPVGSTVSGGLDSTSVAVVAARQLSESGRRLLALTSIPIFEVASYTPKRVGDELPFARAAIRRFANIDHLLIDARELTPLEGVRRMNAIHLEPGVAAGNQYWIAALLSAAQAHGVGVLLTGQQGNGAMSWNGHPTIRSVLSALMTGRARGALKEAARLAHLRAVEPLRLRAMAVQATLSGQLPWYRYSAIHPDFARRVQLLDRLRAVGIEPYAVRRQTSGRKRREAVMDPNANFAGARWAQLAAAHGMVARDPSANLRLIMFAHSIPEVEWRGPLNRWVLRRAMDGLLDDEVRLNPRVGRQAADLVPRMRIDSANINQALAGMAASPLASEYLDCGRLCRIASQLFAAESGTRRMLEVEARILIRGLAIGDFLRQEGLNI